VKKQNGDAIDLGNVDIVLVSCGAKTNVQKNFCYMFFPKTCSLRIPLEQSMLDGKDMLAIDFFSKFIFVPFGKCLVDVNKSWDFGSRRVGKGILGITAVQKVREHSSESIKEAKDGLFDTGCVGFCNGMELEFDPILPMGVEQDGTRREIAGYAKHA
jgi:hypothetical protein